MVGTSNSQEYATKLMKRSVPSFTPAALRTR